MAEPPSQYRFWPVHAAFARHCRTAAPGRKMPAPAMRRPHPSVHSESPPGPQAVRCQSAGPSRQVIPERFIFLQPSSARLRSSPACPHAIFHPSCVPVSFSDQPENFKVDVLKCVPHLSGNRASRPQPPRRGRHNAAPPAARKHPTAGSWRRSPAASESRRRPKVLEFPSSPCAAGPNFAAAVRLRF